jgi:hypothetical protein
MISHQIAIVLHHKTDFGRGYLVVQLSNQGLIRREECALIRATDIESRQCGEGKIEPAQAETRTHLISSFIRKTLSAAR